MSTASISERTALLIAALNRRGIRGRPVKTILRRHPQLQIARQIDYYDHEVVFRAHLPAWAATPWLAHRIRRDVPPPSNYIEASESVARQLETRPFRRSGHGVDQPA